MIARVTPYCDDGQSVPNMVGVLIEGEERERMYVPEDSLLEAQEEARRLRAMLGAVREDGEVTDVDCNGDALE